MKFVMVVREWPDSRRQDPEKFGIKKIRDYGHIDVIISNGFLEISGTITVLDGNSSQIRKMLEEYGTIWICDGPIQLEHYVAVSIDDIKEDDDA